MCVFRTNNKMVCRSFTINTDVSFYIIKDRGTLTAYMHIGTDFLTKIVGSEDSAKSWVRDEIRKHGYHYEII